MMFELNDTSIDWLRIEFQVKFTDKISIINRYFNDVNLNNNVID